MSTTTFTVQVSLPLRQHIRLVGSTCELGKWSPYESIELRTGQNKARTNCTATYSTEVPLTAVDRISYRYLVCENLAGIHANVFAIVKFGPLQSRSVTARIVDDGLLDVNESWVDGWLLQETEVHLTIHDACGYPIRLFQQYNAINKERLRLKISTVIANQDSTRPVEISRGILTKIRKSLQEIPVFPSKQKEMIGGSKFKASGYYDVGYDIKVEVVVVGEYSSSVGTQEDTGLCYDSSKHYSFVGQVLDLSDAMFKIELHCLREDDDKYEHFGSGFILPCNLKASRGIVDVSILNDQRLVAFVQVEYLVIKPLVEKSFHDLDSLIDRNWQNDSRTLVMGHRGCGATFSSSLDGLQENTIESLITACDKGCDGLELDVHVTKDLIPVIYHDLYVTTAFVTKDGRKIRHIQPVHEINYKELQEIWIEHTKSEELNNELISRNDLNRKITPTLHEVLTTVPENYPMELEVKYLETEKDQEDQPFLDVNVYVDAILRTVFQYIGKRKMVFMSFSPVIAQLLNRKQKRVAVKIGVCGESAKYPVYKDIRLRTVGTGTAFAQCERLLGVSIFCDHVLQNPNIVDEMKKRSLVLSTWGVDNDFEDVRERQRKMGVNVLCIDRIHELSK